MSTDLLQGGNAGRGTYCHDPGPRFSLTAGYPGDPRHPSRDPWWIYPVAGGCPSPEALRRHARQDAAPAAADARQFASLQPADTEHGKEVRVSVWVRGPQRIIDMPARFRVVPRLPCLQPRE